MKLSIIIPAFNEKKTIEEVIKRVTGVSFLGHDKEIVIIDDGSTDGTGKLLDELKNKFNFTLIHHPINSGKGAAIKTGLKYVRGDLILIQDADLEVDINDCKKLLEVFNAETTPVVYGSRHLAKNNPHGYFLSFLGRKILTTFFNIIFNYNLTDINTCYKLFRADIIKNANLESNGFEFCEEISAKVLRAGYKIKEIPIKYSPRKFFEGKKVGFSDGLIGIWTILKNRVKKL